MWKKIDNSAVAKNLTIGSIISENPDDPQERYSVKSIEDGFVKAVHTNGKVSVKGLPTKLLIWGNWWVEQASE